MSRIWLLVVLGLTGCVTVQAPAAPEEVDAVEATASVTVSDQCDTSLLTRTDDDDSEFLYGVGEGMSRMRSLARTQAMARARADLVLQARNEILADLGDLLGTSGADPLTARLSADFRQKTEQYTEATLVGLTVTGASLCQEGDLWNFISVVRLRAIDILTEAVENIEAQMISDAEEGRAQIEEFSKNMQDILDKNRPPASTFNT